ncbi:glycosyltransferase involved in cell wall biosynthesis [Desulfobaculum xiamenense]|uniref:Glycosyltransferase involved in cell wall biosynthesis n=1 Tax=Desulfobaculum xiamenense TaxID=995050 RepID=A0A846QND2_9BACT|nr:glycosyltransferase involved in cell wall biosynthesis [Desulfobaculum xiamenense]
MSASPLVSFVIPAYNCAGVLEQCLASIRAQDYPAEAVEILILDGGSTDATRAVAERFGCRVLDNPHVIHPLGRPIGFRAARGELLCCLDSDNILDGTDWLRRMLAPFDDPDICAAEPLWYRARSEDSVPTRYCAAIGGDDPVAVYLGYYDRFSAVTGDWTGAPRVEEDRGGYIKAVFTDSGRIPPLGANGFIVRRDDLMSVPHDPFLHVDVAHRLVKAGRNAMAKVRVGVVHVHAGDAEAFVRKKRRRVMRRVDREVEAFYSYHFGPRDWLRLFGRAFLVVPVWLDALRVRREDPGLGLFHLAMTYRVLGLYCAVKLFGRFLGGGNAYERV